MVGARGVVVTAAGGVAERVIGVIYPLEFLGAGWTFRGVGGNAVGVGFERLSVILLSPERGALVECESILFVCIPDLLLGCAGGYLKDRIWTCLGDVGKLSFRT